MTSFRWSLLALLSISSLALAQDEPPRSLDPRLKIELFAENPQIVTPTGIDVDHAGRVWAIESNTHFPPEGYKGHPTDRVLVMEDTDGDRKADKITVFKDGLTHTMSIAVKPVWLEIGRELRDESRETDKKDGKAPPLALDSRHSALDVFIATRREILLCTDTDGDLKCDETKRLVHLETKGNYPHNGLAGFAFDALGNMFFGFGENLGADYKIIGSDGTTLSGGGEGGNVYRCRPDGSKLERWATGFWNPHASCFDAFGRLFTLDNDPDSRPPCRLLHIIPGGDYGYKFRNGRKGTHPFTSWNGEIPGTLPMVSGTGEAPSGIVCYESDGFPEDYLGTLLVGSWGDHRIDKFVLKPRGASFESLPQPVIKGGENFRPVGLALAPDGSLYVTDWVLKDYKLHGKGRVWRVSAKEENKHVSLRIQNFPSLPEQTIHESIESNRLVVRRIASRQIAVSSEGRSDLLRRVNDQRLGLRSRIEAYWSLVNIASSAMPPDDLADAARSSQKWVKEYGKIDEVTTAALWFIREHPSDGSVRNVVSYAFPSFDAFDNANVLDPLFNLALYYKGKPNEDLAGWPFHSAGFEQSIKDPFRATMRRLELARAERLDTFNKWWSHNSDKPPQSRLLIVLACRSRFPNDSEFPAACFSDSSPLIRGAAAQWVGEENLKELRPGVEKVLASEPMTGELFMACLASLSMLDGVPPAEFEKAPPVQHILPIVKDAQRSASLRAIALRMLPPTLKELDGKLLGTLVASTDEGLRREAVRTLGHSPISERDQLLRGIAADESLDANLRADAVAGLAPVDHHAKLNDATRDLLLKLVDGNDVALAIESLRSLRVAVMAKPGEAAHDAKVSAAVAALDFEMSKREPAESRIPLAEAAAFAAGKRLSPDAARTQYSVLSTGPSPTQPEGDNKPIGDPAAGRRVFFHTNGAGCFKCHTVGGRGGQVGPDLTVIARTMDRQKLAESILEPSKEISPQFTTWAVETTSGKVLTGMLLGEEVNGDLRLGDNTGKIFFVPFKDIETRQPLKTSVMPDKLHEQLTPTEFRNLIAYLETLK